MRQKSRQNCNIVNSHTSPKSGRSVVPYWAPSSGVLHWEDEPLKGLYSGLPQRTGKILLLKDTHKILHIFWDASRSC